MRNFQPSATQFLMHAMSMSNDLRIAFSRRMNDWPRGVVPITSERQSRLKHRIVGGASIITKVVRDRIMKELQVGLGFEIGGGYPSDPNTIKALPELIRKRIHSS